MMPFVDLDTQRHVLGPAIDKAVARVLEHGQFIMGPEVGQLEEQLARRAAVSSAVTCSSGTDALLLPLLAWGIGPGDAVFVPTFTFTATAEVVSLLGATPVFCDVLEDTYNLDPSNLAIAVKQVQETGRLRPRVVIPVDLFGQPADYHAIRAVADEYGLLVLADAAQSFGASFDGSPVGSLADATATSFFPSKPLGCYGDGGAVLTDDSDLAGVLRSLRVHGKGSDKYETVRVGLNARLDTLQAAVLLQKLTIFDEEICSRREVARRYTEGLSGVVETPTVRERAASVWAQYTVRVDDRSEVQSFLNRLGIPTAVYYPRPMHQQSAYATSAVQSAHCPVADEFVDQVLSLPMHPYLEEKGQEYIIRALHTFRA